MSLKALTGLVRKHLTYANLVATLAIFIALGGVSYAAIKIPKNSVGTKQLKKGAVTSAKVKPRSLVATNFKAGQLPRGPQGETGPPGPGARYVGPVVNTGETPSGDGWQVLQTVTGEFPSGIFQVSLDSFAGIDCPAGGVNCGFESGLRIDGGFAQGSLRREAVSAGDLNYPSYQSGFGYYRLSGQAKIELIYRQVAGGSATVKPQADEATYFIQLINELQQSVP